MRIAIVSSLLLALGAGAQAEPCSGGDLCVSLALSMEQARALPDRLVLESDGGQQQIRNLSEDLVEHGGRPTLVFSGVLADRAYTLSADAPPAAPGAPVARQILFEKRKRAELRPLARASLWDASDTAPPEPAREVAAADFESEFSALTIDASGVAEYHANRFRIYFRPPRWALARNLIRHGHGADDFGLLLLQTASAGPGVLARQFQRNFAVFFNGGSEGTPVLSGGGLYDIHWSPVEGIRFWRKNDAAVVPYQLAHANGCCELLGFQLEMGLLGKIDLPDLHTDWVGLVWEQPGRGFAMQTLRRTVDDWTDHQLLQPEQVIRSSWLPESLQSLLTDNDAAVVFKYWNRDHFLAGRRSWIVAAANDPAAGATDPGVPEGLFFLETAGVERYSNYIHQLLSRSDTAGAVLVDYREAIQRVWTALLSNYAAANGFAVERINPSGWTPYGEWVLMQKQSFDGEKAIRATAWTQEVLSLHPAVESQL